MSDVLCPMSDIRCLMSEVLCLISDVLCPKSYVWCQMTYVRCLISDVLCPKSYVWCPICPISDVWHQNLISDVWNQTSENRNLTSDVWYLSSLFRRALCGRSPTRKHVGWSGKRIKLYWNCSFLVVIVFVGSYTRYELLCVVVFSVPVPLICLAPHFRLLRVCEESQHKGDLEGIDALLGKYLFGRYNLRSVD